MKPETHKIGEWSIETRRSVVSPRHSMNFTITSEPNSDGFCHHAQGFAKWDGCYNWWMNSDECAWHACDIVEWVQVWQYIEERRRQLPAAE
jgi:hypothetical protein